MKFTIFSTLCLGFSSAALAATVSEEATHQLAERQMFDRLCGRSMFNEDLVDVESFEGSEVAEPEVNLEARGNNFSGCNTNNGYCTYNDLSKDCECT
ncbi:hypothetical protein BBO_04376 [Beauveria brongniartii RCEF 3172]|uniref:Uncharacterized protein n=1 Tax=Beauveria brongniartii RCEF 3172 TaxID=1081107 RepID=A0A162LSS5_9HYPO|nr:hypothetical protein BBO_04376 [Beauveria brongniartii RCEF 3172]